MTQVPPNPMDGMMAFWKDAMARMGSGPAGAAAGSAAGATFDPMGWMPTPDQVRRMQSGFLDAMSQASDQYMRSPQFVEAMKSSLDSALQARRQVEEFVRRNMTETVAGGAGSSGDVVAVLREMEARLNSRLDDLAARLGELESRDEAPASTSSAVPNGGPRPRRSDR